MQYLTERIKAQNTLRKWVNKTAPLILARLQEGFNQKVGGALYKADQNAMDKLVKDTPFRAYVYNEGETFLVLKADITYSTGETSCNYIKEIVDLVHCHPFLDGIPTFYTFEPRKLLSVKQAEKKLARLESIRDERNALLLEESTLKKELAI